MKRIPKEYWNINYKNIPTKLQQAWIQRCLELLDSNSSYIFSLKSSNLSLAIQDLLNEYDSQNSKIKQPRNYARLIFQIKFYSSECNISYFFNNLSISFNNLYKKTIDYFDEKTGYKKRQIDDLKLKNYKIELKDFLEKINNNDIKNSIKLYRTYLIRECKRELLNNGEDVTSNHLII